MTYYGGEYLAGRLAWFGFSCCIERSVSPCPSGAGMAVLAVTRPSSYILHFLIDIAKLTHGRNLYITRSSGDAGTSYAIDVPLIYQVHLL